ncbi:MAG: hypothetical protein FJX76_21485 [Armatimonadetes bacterium]|nr:hypothetical protein [Armatimonadota bacterium]
MQAISAAFSPTFMATRSTSAQATYVENCDRRVECPVSTEILQSRLERLARTNRSAAGSAVALDASGRVSLISDAEAADHPESQKVLPLRLGALQTFFHQVERDESWLLSRDPIFYMDREGKAHLDYVNLAGFVVDPMGTVLSRAVNPW